MSLLDHSPAWLDAAALTVGYITLSAATLLAGMIAAYYLGHLYDLTVGAWLDRRRERRLVTAATADVDIAAIERAYR